MGKLGKTKLPLASVFVVPVRVPESLMVAPERGVPECTTCPLIELTTPEHSEKSEVLPAASVAVAVTISLALRIGLPIEGVKLKEALPEASVVICVKPK